MITIINYAGASVYGGDARYRTNLVPIYLANLDY